MARLNRESFLQRLQSVQPGLSQREIIEQSSCFVFRDRMVVTYNDEVAAKIPLPEVEFEGAVRAKPLLDLLSKMTEEEIDLSLGEGELVVSGKKKHSGIQMDKEIMLSIAMVETPKKWSDLHVDFVEAVDLASQCVGKDTNAFKFTCLHVHPKWIESSDNFQILRYRIPTGVESPFLVKQVAIKCIGSLGVNQIALTDNWVHFRNPANLVLSCRRFIEDYPKMGEFLKMENGTSVVFPKGLAEAVDKASIFSVENTDSNQILVDLLPGKLRIKGNGVSGWYKETRKIQYSGTPIQFLISPSLLTQITQKHNECELTKDRLRVDGGKFVYVASLASPQQEKEEPQE